VIEFVSPPDALVLCAAFNEPEANLFATGNSLSEMQLWNFKSRSPVEVPAPHQTFATAGSSGAADSVTAVCFDCSGTLVFGGSLRGSVHVGDIHSGKGSLDSPSRPQAGRPPL